MGRNYNVDYGNPHNRIPLPSKLHRHRLRKFEQVVSRINVLYLPNSPGRCKKTKPFPENCETMGQAPRFNRLLSQSRRSLSAISKKQK